MMEDEPREVEQETPAASRNLAQEEEWEIKMRFTYHPPNPEQLPKYTAIRAGALDLAKQILSMTPVCREQSLALSHLEEVMMWANAAIARRE